MTECIALRSSWAERFEPIVVVFGLLAALISSPGFGGVEVREGKAFSLATGELVYLERHEEEFSDDGEPVRCQVFYLTPGGEVFARKEISFVQSRTAPDFELVDLRDGFREGARFGKNGLDLWASRGEESVSTRGLALPVNAVVDAGFHRFVQNNISELAKGSKVVFSFAVPTEGRFFKFRLDKVEALTYRDRPAMLIRMKPANPLLRFLVDPIDLIYGTDGELWEFAGLSNIPDSEGERHQARIVFEGREETTVLASVATTSTGSGEPVGE